MRYCQFVNIISYMYKASINNAKYHLHFPMQPDSFHHLVGFSALIVDFQINQSIQKADHNTKFFWIWRLEIL